MGVSRKAILSGAEILDAIRGRYGIQNLEIHNVCPCPELALYEAELAGDSVIQPFVKAGRLDELAWIILCRDIQPLLWCYVHVLEVQGQFQLSFDLWARESAEEDPHLTQSNTMKCNPAEFLREVSKIRLACSARGFSEEAHVALGIPPLREFCVAT